MNRSLAIIALLLVGWPLLAQEAEDAPELGADLEGIEELLEADEDVLAGADSAYDDEGRRDPFRSLLETTGPEDGERPPGVPGLLIDELDLKGIFMMAGQWVALIETANRDESYLLRAGDQLFDGDVVRIESNELAFKQIINDPKNFKPFREVVKKLNPEP